MAAAAVAAQVEIPPVVLFLQPQLVHARLEHVETLLSLAAADDLADAGDKTVRRRDGLSVVVEAHVKGLDLARIVRDEDGLFEDLLGEIALMLGLQVDAPFDRIVELLAALFEDVDRLGIADAAEIVRHDVVQPLEQALVDESVEELHLLRAAFEHRVDDVLDHRLGRVHIVIEIGKGHLRLDHPEFGRVALGIGDLGAEGGAEGVDVAEGEGKVLGVELAGDREVRGLAEEVLAVVHRAVFFQRQVVEIQRRHAEHLARALGVGAGDDRRLGIDEAAALEKFMHGPRRDAAHAEDRGKQVRTRAQMLDRAQKFDAVALFLQRIVRRGHALDGDLVGLEFEGLLGLGREDERSPHDQGSANVLACDLIVIVQSAPLEDDLQRLEAAAVVELGKAEVLHVAHGPDPAAYGDLAAVKRARLGIDARNFLTFHWHLSFLCIRCGIRKFFHGAHMCPVKWYYIQIFQ